MGEKIQRRRRVLCALGGHRLQRVEFKGYIDRRIRNNRRVSIDETVSEMDISHALKLFKDPLRPNRNLFFLMGSYWL